MMKNYIHLLLLKSLPRCLIAMLLVFAPSFFSYGSNLQKTERITIYIGEIANDIEIKTAALLKDRILEKSGVAIDISQESEIDSNSGDFSILLGRPDHHNGIAQQLRKHRIPELSALAPGPEGFLLRQTEVNLLVAAGYDDRGCLYVVGELLRQITFRSGHVLIPENLNIRTAPAFEIRGTQFGQSHVARQVAKVRPWTMEETQRVILDEALSGANIFSVGPGPMFEFIKSYGLMTQGGFGANTAPEVDNPAWMAYESIGRNGYVCPSVKEARAYMLDKFEKVVSSGPGYDLYKFHGGDGGGCECDRCDPYGLTFIKLVEDMARIIHRYHPDTKVYFTNQKFDNEDDLAIFEYLNEKPRDWLWAWGYGPGSDATTWQPGHRQNHRMDLFVYPGFGPYGLYPLEIIRQMPSRHKLVYYNEITHWKYAQHAYIQMYPRADKNGELPPHWSHDIYERRPDQYLTMVYNRLTFYAWPRQYHRVFNDLMRYGIGDITHSSGHHDHFNQWMWQRLLWSPRRAVEDVVDEYCRTWFGEEAAPFMAKAVFLLEENMEENPENSLPEKEGVKEYYNLVKKAGAVMPENLMKDNWLWRMFMQKGALDRYVQLSVLQQMELQGRVEAMVRQSLNEGAKNATLSEALNLIESDTVPTDEMTKLKEEAGNLGEESNTLFGVRNDGFFNLEHDFIGLGWLSRQLSRALDAKGKARVELLNMIVDYENPGEGGYYDNLGTGNHTPNVVAGYPYDHGQPYVGQMLSEGNRPSQRSMHFTQDEKQGVTLHYRDLDPDATYKIRLTLVRPWFQERYAMRMNQNSESIYADDVLLAKNLELPLQMSDFFTFKIPKNATKDGEVIIRFEKSPEVANGDMVTVEQWRNSGGWGTIVSEAWLIKD
jgi:hypothetical protein